MKKRIFIFMLILLLFLIVFIIYKEKHLGYIKYKKEKYILLEYKTDIFTYNFHSNNYYEEDIIHPVFHNNCDMVYFNGDLFFKRMCHKKVTNYYRDDENYDWYFVLDNDDKIYEYKISLSEDELNYLYNLENIKKKDTIIFDDIKCFGEIKKVSKDNVVFGIITLAYVNNEWVWKSEIMNDFDEEYVVKLPVSLNQKIGDCYEL